MIEQALSHIHSGEGNCATACYRALLPDGVEPSPLHDYIVSNISYVLLEHIAACAALETYRRLGWLCACVVMPDSQSPTDFLAEMMANTTDDLSDKGVVFLGALIRRTFIHRDTQKITGHAIAVSDVDSVTGLATIVDRAPHEILAFSYTVPVSKLNELVTKQWIGELSRMVALVGLTPNDPSYHLPEYQTMMKDIIQDWTAWEQSFNPVYEAHVAQTSAQQN